ncbi:MAG TPA: gamma-glutamyl-gamma-aminobutyrate hydrolase family protein [Solirubrobacteraceae bacterium]|nr:gamma-glutamyl-gamma-aminobutyrate hydrolase family protein [Solirubrobacteraceae bacterium]
MTPNIGVTCNLETVQYGGLWTEAAAMVPLSYVRAVAHAGGRPLLLAPTPADLADPTELLDLLDGVLVTGGADLDPDAYGEPAHAETEATSAERDAFELLLVRAAVERDLPCLGVCRGMQVVNVAYGGALEQHLPDRLDHDIHRGENGDFAEHRVEIEPDSLAALAAGATRATVKSYHHQGVARVGDGLRVTAQAEGDGTAEAVEDARRRFMLGVLWHPEEDEADRLIGAFVRACRRP